MSWWLLKSWRRRCKYQRGVNWKMPRKKQQNPQPVKCTYRQISPVLEIQCSVTFVFFSWVHMCVWLGHSESVSWFATHIWTPDVAAVILHQPYWTADGCFVKSISHSLKDFKKFGPLSVCFSVVSTYLMRLTKCSFIDFFSPHAWQHLSVWSLTVGMKSLPDQLFIFINPKTHGKVFVISVVSVDNVNTAKSWQI